MVEASPGATVEFGRLSVTSTSETPAQIKAAIAQTDPKLVQKAAEPDAVAEEKPKEEAKPAAAPDKAPEGEQEPEKAKEAKPDKEEGEDKAEKPEEKPKKGNPRHDPVARMLEATRKEAEAKREAAAERKRAAELEERLKAAERPEPEKREAKPEGPRPDGKPKPEDFDEYEQYLDARDAHNRREWEREAAQRARASQIEQARRSRYDHFKAQINKAVAADPTFQDRLSFDVVSLRPLSKLGPDATPEELAFGAVAEEIISSDNTPGLLLHFSDHPEDLQRFATLHPRALVREMAKLEARLEAATAGTPAIQAVSKAKPPVRPVTGSPHITDVLEELPDTLSDTEWLKRAQAQQRRASRG